jgi:hypothetical protein
MNANPKGNGANGEPAGKLVTEGFSTEKLKTEK